MDLWAQAVALPPEEKGKKDRLLRMFTLSEEQLEMIEIFQRKEIDGLSFEDICGELHVECVNAVRKLKAKVESYRGQTRKHQAAQAAAAQQEAAMNNKGNVPPNTRVNPKAIERRTAARNNAGGRRGLPKIP